MQIIIIDRSRVCVCEWVVADGDIPHRGSVCVWAAGEVGGRVEALFGDKMTRSQETIRPRPRAFNRSPPTSISSIVSV